MIFAFSVQDFVDKIGAYVGFAAAIGLALFAMLLFAQARELKRLREWGAHAHDRIGELERRLAAALELARRASTSQRTMAPGAGTGAQRPAPARPAAPARAAPAVARTSSPTRLPLLPAAPARVGGAALGSATVFVPLPKQPPGAVPVAAPAGAPAATPATSPPTAPGTVPAVAAAASAVVASPAATPAPATAAGKAPSQPAAPAPVPAAPAPAPPAASNGHSDTFPPVPPVRRAMPRPGARPAAGRRVPPRGPARPARPAGARPAAAAPLRARSAPSASPRGNESVEAPHGRRRLALLLGGLGLVAVAAIAVLVLSDGGNDSPSTPTASSNAPTQQTTPASRQTTPAAAAPAHDRITVAVLNGTTTAGLASTVAATLTSDGFVQGPVTNASDQARSVTVVSYFGGHEAEAQEVAKTLNVPADAVQPIDADTEAACAQGATCVATAVVTVGADQQ
ncbi:MAG TPA: LytR C-terminal domain-containing protein [Conexibacter sp.]|nr:LytR C-terminal domain-containing protein [Conexibacter sp.]